MRSSTTVYRADGTPIQVVTVENRKTTAEPAITAPAENKYKMEPAIENKQPILGPRIASSEHDRSK
jgi:hypothetical protein